MQRIIVERRAGRGEAEEPGQIAPAPGDGDCSVAALNVGAHDERRVACGESDPASRRSLARARGDSRAPGRLYLGGTTTNGARSCFLD
jgi:hypothetical protein